MKDTTVSVEDSICLGDHLVGVVFQFMMVDRFTFCGAKLFVRTTFEHVVAGFAVS